MRPTFVFRISLYILEDKVKNNIFFVACLNKLCHMVKTLCTLPGTDVFRSEIISPNFVVNVSLSHPIVTGSISMASLENNNLCFYHTSVYLCAKHGRCVARNPAS